MKKFLTIISLNICFLTSSMLSLSAQDAPENTFTYPSFQILASFNLGYAYNPDMNDWTEARGDELSDYYNDLAGANDFSSKTSAGDFVIGVDAELRFFSDNFGFGAGTGYSNCEAEAEVKGSGWSDKGIFTLNLDVIPLIGTLYYRKALTDRSFILFGAGAGYYMATMNAEYKDKDTIPGDDGYDYDFKASAIGYHVKCEYNHLFSSFFVSGGVLARYVEFDKFEDDGIKIIMDNGDNLGAGLTGATVYVSAGVFI